MTPLAPGTSVHEWEVVQRLGEARHGSLFEVERAGRTFTMKWLTPSLLEPPKGLAEREAACLRLLQGPLFAALEAHGVCPERGAPFLVMEAIAGMRFSKWFRQPGPTAHDMAHVVNPRVPRSLSEIVMKLLLPDPEPASYL